MSPRPPFFAAKLLRVLVGPELADYVEGDLAEEFGQRASTSKTRARFWYWSQVLSWDLLRLRRESHWQGETDPTSRESWTQDWLHDLRLAVRTLASRPGFASVVVLVLSLGIAVFSTLFGVVHAVFLEPLPYEEPHRLVVVWEDATRIGGGSRWTWNRTFYDAFREETGFHEQMAASFPFPAALLFEDGAESIATARVSPGFFELFGRSAEMGRTFREGDRGAVVLSHGLWRRHFNADPNVVGEDVAIEDLNPLRDTEASAPRELYTVIGVMPAEFHAPMSFGRPATLAEMWIPLHPEEAVPRPFTRVLNVVARLREGIALDEARAEAATVYESIVRRFPAHEGRDVSVVPLFDNMVGDVRSTLWLLAAATGVLVVLVLANLGNLFVTRGLVRSNEMTLRTALGAPRTRLVRFALTESLVLCVVSAAVGAVLASMVLPLVIRWMPDAIPRLENASIGATPLAVAAGVATLAAVLFTFLSMLTWRQSDAQLKRFSDSRRRLQTGSVLVQTTVTVLLLVASGLSIQSLANLLAVDPGVEIADRLTFQLRLPQTRYPTDVAKIRTLTEMHRRIEALPGVVASGSSDQIPPDRGGSGGEFVSPLRQDAVHMALRTVTHHYLDALGLDVIQGRSFRESDDLHSDDVLLLSESAARILFPDITPIGREVSPAVLVPGSQWPKTVVGVVPDLPTFKVDGAPFLEIYQLHEQAPWGQHKFVVHTRGDALAQWSGVREAVRSVDGQLPLIEVRALDELVARALSRPVFLGGILGLFTAAAVLLSAVGTFGVLSYVVAQRLREVAIRLAVGASPRRIVMHFIYRVAAVSVVGIACGTLLALGGRSALASHLYGVSESDPTSYLIATAVALGASVLAALPAARRAASTDPAVVLKLD